MRLAILCSWLPEGDGEARACLNIQALRRRLRSSVVTDEEANDPRIARSVSANSLALVFEGRQPAQRTL